MRWGLGGAFAYSAVHKVLLPAQFAKIIYGYQLFPAVTINLLAITLPYLELFAGLCLLTGIYPRSSALLVNGLLAGFIAAVTANLVRGHTFDCGCFAFGETGSRSSAVQLLVRDLVLLFAGCYVMLFNGSRRAALKSTGGLLRGPCRGKLSSRNSR